MAWALDRDRDDRLLVLGFPCFAGRMQTWVEDESQLGNARLTHTASHEWNHGLGKILTALLRRGLVYSSLRGIPGAAAAHALVDAGVPGRLVALPADLRDRGPLM